MRLSESNRDSLPILYPWQEKELIHNLAPKWAELASPRVGKSRYALEWLKGLDTERCLILAPRRVCPQWALMARQMGYEDVIEAQGMTRVEVRALLRSKPDALVIMNDDKLAECIEEGIKWLTGCALIVDECHRFAGVSTKRARAMRRLAWKADFVRLLTGTPVPRHEGSLWGQMVAVDREHWGTSYERFAQQFLIRDAMFPSRVLGTKNLDKLHEMLRSGATITPRESVFGPDKWNTVHRQIELPDNARKLYNKLAREWVLEEPVDMTVDVTVTRMLRLQQLTSGYLPGEDGPKEIHTAKLDAVLADLDEIVTSGEKCIVYHRFRFEGQRLHEEIRKEYGKHARVLTLNGDTTEDEGEEVYAAVEQDRGSVIPIVQIQAGGIGRSFAQAQHEMFVSETFSLTEHEQARDRIFCPGQVRTVTDYRCRRTIDEYIGKALDKKQDVHASVMNATRTEIAYG